MLSHYNVAHSVVVAKNWFNKIPIPCPNEAQLLEDLEVEVKSEMSRLGSQIIMTKELDGLTVFIPDPLPSDIP